ncbi:MAG: tetratricopeptide repeat protein [Phycisphaerales bacterium]
MSRLQAKIDESLSLVHAGRAIDAMNQLQRLFQQAPRDVGVLSAMLYACRASADFGKAEFYAKQLAALMPQHSDAHANLGLVLSQLGEKKRGDAIAAYQKALAISPENANARVGLANVLLEAGKPAEALAVCEASATGARDGQPHAQLAISHASALLAMVRSDDALAVLNQAAKFYPHEVQLHILRCAAMHSSVATKPVDIANAHGDVGRAILGTLTAVAPLEHGVSKAGTLRVGVLSPDLRTHSVAFFAEPLLEHLDKARFELHAFHNTPLSGEDAFSKRLKAHFASWTNVASQPDDVLLQLMRSKQLDVVLDLTGLAGHHRLRLLAARVAPVQVTYCGYPDTTGVPSVDYRVVDSQTDPVRESDLAMSLRANGQPDFDERCAEKLIRVDPCFLCYKPPMDAPVPTMASEPEVGREGGVTFASFNTVRKLNPFCVEMWSGVLRRVAGSKLVLKSKELQDPAMVASLRAMFDEHGVADRVEFLQPTKSVAEHLALYSRVHVALDTFPYHGTTTTCEALWMGVPVVTLAGDRHASRVGVSLLTNATRDVHGRLVGNVNLDELVTQTPEQFAEVASKWAADANRLRVLRSDMRKVMQSSALCDAPAFAGRFGEALLKACGRSSQG